MRRSLLTVALLAAAAIAVVAIGLVLRAQGADTAGSASSRRASLAVVSATVRPPVHLFGDPITAELVVVANKELVDPDTVRVRPDFTPYATGQRRVERTETAQSVRYRFIFSLRCLDQECVPESSHRVIDLPGTAVFYRFRSAGGPGTAIVDWPDVAVAARVPSEALSPERWRADVSSVPPASYARSPGPTSFGLVVASIVLALVGVGLVWWLTRPSAREELQVEETEEIRTSALERALELAREAALDDSPERRKAFERVARELAARGLTDLADRARTLAWASGAANAVLIDELERDALAATNGSQA